MNFKISIVSLVAFLFSISASARTPHSGSGSSASDIEAAQIYGAASEAQSKYDKEQEVEEERARQAQTIQYVLGLIANQYQIDLSQATTHVIPSHDQWDSDVTAIIVNTPSETCRYVGAHRSYFGGVGKARGLPESLNCLKRVR